jgi:hypothetical protein
MRASLAARWATCAFALTLCLPAVTAYADKTPKSLATCTSFDQADKGDDAVAFTLHNTCTVPVDCEVTWRVVCAPDSKKRRSAHAGSAKLNLPQGSSDTTDASASICGDEGWSIDSIEWSCQPNKD